MARVVITARSVANCQEGRDLLTAAGHEVIIRTGSGPWGEADMTEIIQGVDAAIVGLDEVSEKVLAAGAPTLKVVARNGVGYNKVAVAAAKERGIAVTLAPGTNTISVCELVFALMLGTARHVCLQNEEVHEGGWQRVMGCELYGKTLGIVGTGSIGSEVIKRAHAFGMKILAFDLWQKQELIDLYGAKYVSLDEIYEQADFISLHVPATPETKGMIQAATIAKMKPTAILINTARGDLIVEQDLYEALKANQIAGYGADAMIQEPPGEDHPLLSLPNVIITPHCGAYTKEAVIRCSVTAAEEVVRVLKGETPRYPVSQ
ncbi:MAG: phosphoglycerate dehydrogenase [Sporomusaceae bacterium]|nr:phosphoglycerate dehydrogenase [Sporomusaceae bacterium]